MTSPSPLSIEALPESLEPGDVLLNLTDQELACSVPFVTNSGEQLQTGFLAPSVAARPTATKLISLCESADRLVVVGDDPGGLVEQLTAAGQTVKWIQLTADCGSDSFMDEEDSEAVAERLRQLGYI